MSRTRKLRGRTERFLALRYWLLESQAWRSLPGNARALYIEIAARYNGSNNGRIPYSVREAIIALHISGATASRLLKVLQDLGFIVCTKKGAFSMKASREASEWRLTEHSDDVIPNHPTKEFMSWRPPELDFNETPKLKTRLLRRNRTVALVKPHGCPGETVNSKKGSDGDSGETVNGQVHRSTLSAEQHLQLPGTGYAGEGGERSAPTGSAVASEPPEWRQVELPLGSPSRAEVLATLKRQAEERWRALSPTSGHRAGPLESAAPSSR
jgi:hypothetical protein